MSDCFKHRYGVSDFLYYLALLSIPVITAVIAILDVAGMGSALLFLVVAAACIPVMLRFFCTHCPHYCRKEEPRLNCLFFRGLPKFFTPRPGPLSLGDKLLSLAAPSLMLVFPLYWLIRRPGLLIIYLVSLIVFGATMRRNECPRCIYTDCPANIAPWDGKTE